MNNNPTTTERRLHFEQIDIDSQIQQLISARHDPIDFSTRLSRTTQKMREAYEKRLREITLCRDRITEQLQLQEQLRRESEITAESMVRMHRELIRHQQRRTSSQKKLQESEEWLGLMRGPVEEMIAEFDQQVGRVNEAIVKRKLTTKPLGRFDVRYSKQHGGGGGGSDKDKANGNEEASSEGKDASHPDGTEGGKETKDGLNGKEKEKDKPKSAAQQPRRQQQQQQPPKGGIHSDAQWYDWVSWLHREMIPDDPMMSD